MTPSYVAVLALLVLTGCSPRYDWREVRSDTGWLALFPDKPNSQTRAVNLEGWSFDMTMTVARVEDVSFAIGYAVVPEQTAMGTTVSAAKPGLSEMLRDGMLRNIKAASPSEHVVQITRIGQGATPIPALAVAADGQIGDKAAHLSARFALYSTGSKQQVIQMMVLGPTEILSRPAGQQAIETFLTSLKVE